MGIIHLMLSKQFLGMSREFVFDPLYNNKDILLIRKQVILMQFIISHHRICVLAGSLYYSLLANTIYNRQIYGATTIKNGRVIAWKVIMTVKAAGLRRSGC